MSVERDKRLPLAALALGIVGLFTGGLLGVGSLAALGLAAVGLSRARRDPQRYGGRDLAWAAVAASVFGLFSLPLLLALGLTLRPMLAQDDNLPTPVQESWPLTADRPPPPPSRAVGIEAAASAGGEPEPVHVGAGIVEPRKLRSVPPVYPELARQARVQGTVVLECTISPEGRVTDVRVLRGVPLLDEAARDAVRQWVYTPTLLDGRPVPVIMTVTVNFRLS